MKKYNIKLLILLLTTITLKAQNSIEMKGNIAFSTFPSSKNLNAFTISPLFEIGYKIQKDYYFGVKLGISYTNLEREGYNKVSRIDLSNPIITFGYLENKITEFSKINLMLNVGIPLATFPGNIPQNRLSEFNYNNANNMYGFKELPSWLMNVIPLSLGIMINNDISEHIKMNISINPIYLISINSRPDKQVIDGGLKFDYKINNMIITIGTNHLYSFQSLENDDVERHSLYIGNSYNWGDYSLGAECNMNLDYPNLALTKEWKNNYGIILKINKRMQL